MILCWSGFSKWQVYCYFYSTDGFLGAYSLVTSVPLRPWLLIIAVIFFRLSSAVLPAPICGIPQAEFSHLQLAPPFLQQLFSWCICRWKPHGKRYEMRKSGSRLLLSCSLWRRLLLHNRGRDSESGSGPSGCWDLVPYCKEEEHQNKKRSTCLRMTVSSSTAGMSKALQCDFMTDLLDRFRAWVVPNQLYLCQYCPLCSGIYNLEKAVNDLHSQIASTRNNPQEYCCHGSNAGWRRAGNHVVLVLSCHGSLPSLHERRTVLSCYWFRRGHIWGEGDNKNDSSPLLSWSLSPLGHLPCSHSCSASWREQWTTEPWIVAGPQSTSLCPRPPPLQTHAWHCLQFLM